MQLLRLSSSPSATLSVLILLLKFSIFTNASPTSLYPRDGVCADTTYIPCKSETGGAYCCPPNTKCAANSGCTPITAPTPTPDPTPTPPPTAAPAATQSPFDNLVKKVKKFFTTNVIIAVSTGGGVALLGIIAGSWACHRKRREGRALLAAYESPDRTPYEEISLRTKRSSSFNSAAPPAPGVDPMPVAPTSINFGIAQHPVNLPLDYNNGSIAQGVDEKEVVPRYPPQTFQGQDSLGTPGGSQRGPFPVETLSPRRLSSLPPYSPTRSGFANQQGTGSPQVPGTAFSTPTSPRASSHGFFLPQGNPHPTNQELYHGVGGHQPPPSRQPQRGYLMGY